LSRAGPPYTSLFLVVSGTSWALRDPPLSLSTSRPAAADTSRSAARMERAPAPRRGFTAAAAVAFASAQGLADTARHIIDTLVTTLLA
jgi:hypothetical protein